MVACRALSIDRDASMAVRMQRDMQKLGEAAGLAAALCVKNNLLPDELEVSLLQEHLIRRKVIASEDLHREETPDIQFRTGSLKDVVLNVERKDDFIPQLLDYLGCEEEGKALWWLWKCGSTAASSLLDVMQKDESERKRSAAAFVLGLSGRKEAIPTLLDTMVNMDEEVAEQAKPFPRWIAALTILRLLKAEEALPAVLNALAQPQESNTTHLCFSIWRGCFPNYLKKTADMSMIHSFAGWMLQTWETTIQCRGASRFL